MAKRKSRGTSPEMIDFFKKLRWYPEAKASDHYVFLNTLKKDNPSLQAAAQALLKVNGQIEDFQQEAHLEKALTFLEKAANSEKSKEINFLRSKGIEVSEKTNFLELIKLINEAIIGLDELKRRIEVEQNRTDIKGKGAYSYTQGMGSYIKSALRQLQGQSKERDTIAGVVRSSLIRATNSLHGSLDIEQIATIIGASQSQIMAAITEELQEDGLQGNVVKEKYLNKDGSINQPAVEKLIKQTKVYQDNFSIKSEKKKNELKMIANNICSKYSLILSSKAKNEIKKNFNDLPKNSQNKIDWKNIMLDSRMMSSLNDLDSEDLYTFNFERNTGMGGEARIYQDLRDNIPQWVGGSGGKIDVFAYVIGEAQVKEKKDKKKIEAALQQISENITQKTQSEFEKVGQKISDAYENIESVLQKISQELGELQQSFILHNNIKDYYSTAQTNKFDGFDGGTWGGLSFVDSIAALSEVGFPTSDLDWLKTCLVNTASMALGASNKENLEKYLSLFATMVLFDDGITIAQDTQKNFQNTSLNVLHLFPVNGVYVPSSYVMSQIANSLRQWQSSDAAKVKINPGNVNFSQELKNMSTEENHIYGPPRWRAISDKQIAAMSIRIKFLANFNNIINDLTSS